VRLKASKASLICRTEKCFRKLITTKKSNAGVHLVQLTKYLWRDFGSYLAENFDCKISLSSISINKSINQLVSYYLTSVLS